MKIRKEISVVMSVYRGDVAMHFRDSVNSLLKQTYMPAEIIVVVDGEVKSEVNLELIKFSQNKLINIVRLPQNKGLANALNVGISKASCKYIARMDSDDICSVDRFQKQYEHLLNNNLDIVGGQIIEFGENVNDVISERKVPLEHNEIVKFLKTRSPFSHPTIIFKKEVFDKIEGYDVKVFPEDYDFFVRAFLSGFKFGNVKENVLWFRIGADQKSALKRRHGLKYAKNEFKLYKKFYNYGYYNLVDFFKVFLFKLPLRILPFPIFSYLYSNLFRKI